VPFVLHHHERFDGRGYPRGLTGHAIPIEGRLLAAVELCETRRASRANPTGLDRAALAREIRNEARAQLDPEMALTLSHLIASGALDNG
jgi:response regulator RpfG family c-di-GMP phosphodiesterase